MLAQIEDHDPAAGHDDASRFGESAGGIGRVVKCLGQHRHINAGVAQREFLELAAFPNHVAHASALRQAACPLEHDRRPIDGNHARCPAAGFDSQIALATAQVGDAQRGQQVAQRPGPGRPAPAGNELTILGIRPGVRVEILFAQAAYFRQSRVVGPSRGGPAERLEVVMQEGSERGRAINGLGRRRLKVGEPSVTLFDGETGLFQQPQVAGHTRLGDAEDAGELADI